MLVETVSYTLHPGRAPELLEAYRAMELELKLLDEGEDEEDAEKEAEGAAIADSKRDGYGKFARECAMACGMAEMDFDAEGAEDLIIQRIRGIAEQLAAIQERERAAMGVAVSCARSSGEATT